MQTQRILAWSLLPIVPLLAGSKCGGGGGPSCPTRLASASLSATDGEVARVSVRRLDDLLYVDVEHIDGHAIMATEVVSVLSRTYSYEDFPASVPEWAYRASGNDGPRGAVLEVPSCGTTQRNAIDVHVEVLRSGTVGGYDVRLDDDSFASLCVGPDGTVQGYAEAVGTGGTGGGGGRDECRMQ